jgi:hypothetical protein
MIIESLSLGLRTMHNDTHNLPPLFAHLSCINGHRLESFHIYRPFEMRKVCVFKLLLITWHLSHQHEKVFFLETDCGNYISNRTMAQ